MITTDKKDLRAHLLDLHLPVADWEVDTGTDSLGEDAVWVWAIVDDTVLESLTQDDRARLRVKVREAMNRAADRSDPVVYTYFRGTSEV
jgi:hypothetical protein